MDTVRVKDLVEYEVGDYVADMHYGRQQLDLHFKVEELIGWSEVGCDDFMKDPDPSRPVPHFSDYLRDVTRYAGKGSYSNKILVVLMNYGYEGYMICAYSYDGRRCGIVKLSAKE